MMGKRGRLKKWKTIFVDSPSKTSSLVQIQIAERVTGAKLVQVYIPINEIDIRYKAVWYLPSYKGLKKIIEGLIEVEGKEKVEKELGMKIK